MKSIPLPISDPHALGYPDRVYAGVLGKMIGVYLGRPFEQWRWARIEAELGEINGYMHERLGVPLIVADDDLSGTFTFLRALPDCAFTPALTSAQIGQAWLNYLIEGRTVLWWGGLGNSTEHSAYLRLKAGIPAPESGSMARNGRTTAEQIGAQIFIDGWGLICPGDPAQAADFAGRAARVSHDGEAVYAAQVVAALVAAAFAETDLDRLLDTAVGLIPADSQVARLIAHLRMFHAAEPDWRAARALVYDQYGYERYPGSCHIIPNHALVILALLYSGGDFPAAQRIVNTCGYDTDCNAGNVGCILGVRGGLAAFDGGPDWRGPVADRLYLSTADGARGITDAATEALHIVQMARRLAGAAPLHPKEGARWHFSLPGSVQGWMADDPTRLTVVNEGGLLALRGHSLDASEAARASVTTCIPPHDLAGLGYGLYAAPVVYAGQTLCARLTADLTNRAPISAGLSAQVYARASELARISGPSQALAAGESAELTWTLPTTDGQPLCGVSVELRSSAPSGKVYLEWVRIDGAPNVTLQRPADCPRGGSAAQGWRRAWVDAVDQWETHWPSAFHLAQNRGRGMLSTGGEWTDYVVEATMTTDLAAALGLAARAQGLRRYYAGLLRAGGRLQLIRMRDDEMVLAEVPFAWEAGRAYALRLTVQGARLTLAVDGQVRLSAADDALRAGGIALVVEEGFVRTDAVTVSPVDS